MLLKLMCHLLLHCSHFITHRNVLLDAVNPILRVNNFPFLDDIELLNLLLYGNEKLKLEDNQKVLIATINFIGNNSRFTQNLMPRLRFWSYPTPSLSHFYHFSSVS